MTKPLKTTLALAVLVASATLTSAGEVYSTRCQRDRAALSCTMTRFEADSGPRVISVPHDDSPEREDRVRAWLEFCRPEPAADMYGVERLQYAHEGCEFGRTR